MKLHARFLGDKSAGKALVILHGLLGSSDNWFTLGKQFAENYYVCLIDQRNHGLSPWHQTWNYEVMADDLHEFVAEHALEQPIIIGHSMGGKTAMLYAGKYPHMLARLVVVDIAPRYYPPHHQAILEGLNAIDLPTLASRQAADQQLAQFVSQFDTRQFLLKNLYRKEDNSFAWRMNLPVITQNIEEVGQTFPTDLHYEGKTLFMRGGKSDYITENDVQNLATHFPQAELVTIPDAGHWIHAEQPQKFLAAVNQFLQA